MRAVAEYADSPAEQRARPETGTLRGYQRAREVNEHVADLIVRLTERLGPVLAPAPVESKGDCAEVLSGGSEVARQFDLIADFGLQHVDRLQYLLDTLDV